jgi:hypothetical protein
MEKYYYTCDCGTEMLVIEPEIDAIDENRKLFFLNLSIWLYGYNSKPSWYERLRHCWHILKTGQNYADEIILSYAQAEKLSQDLHFILNRYITRRT